MVLDSGRARKSTSPGCGNRNLFFDWKNRAAREGKVTRSNGKYYRAYPENAMVM
jgi:hypothetical protein